MIEKAFLKLLVIRLSDQITSENFTVRRCYEFKRSKLYDYIRYVNNNRSYKYPFKKVFVNIKINKQNLFLLIVRRSQIFFNFFDLKKFLFSLHNLYFYYIILKGIGYKIFILNKNVLSFSVGKSHKIIKILPPYIYAALEGNYHNRLIISSKFQIKAIDYCNYLVKIKKKNKYLKKGLYILNDFKEFYE